MIIRGGENIYPHEIENVLHAHPAVLKRWSSAVPIRSGRRTGRLCGPTGRPSGGARGSGCPLPAIAGPVQGSTSRVHRSELAKESDRKAGQGTAPQPSPLVVKVSS
jgi:acyl-CoA synthetase (AMP-forming)/AMP-acid ligase II